MKPHEIRAALMLAQTKIKDIAELCELSTPAVHQVIVGNRPNKRIRAAIAQAINKPVSEIWPAATPTQEEAA